MGLRNDNFTAKIEENAVREAASGLESVEKLIRLLSHTQQQYQSSSTSKPSMEIDVDYKAVADAAVSKFKKVISLLGRTRTGHARFRRAPVLQQQHPEPKVYDATPLQQIPPKDGVTMERNDSSKTINFSYYSSLTGDTDRSKQQPASSSPATTFQITNLSQVSSAGKPPLSTTSSLKRKCSSENLGSGKCVSASSSGRCHCSKKRYIHHENRSFITQTC